MGKKKPPTPHGQVSHTAWDTPDGHELIKGWARDGLIDVDIAKQIGIHVSTLRKWKTKYEGIRQALKEGKEVADRKVESALFKRALGYEYDEVKVAHKYHNGERVEEQTVTRKAVPGDVTAQIIWLKNRKPELWRRGEEKPGSQAGDVEDLAPLAKLLGVQNDGSK